MSKSKKVSRPISPHWWVLQPRLYKQLDTGWRGRRAASRWHERSGGSPPRSPGWWVAPVHLLQSQSEELEHELTFQVFHTVNSATTNLPVKLLVCLIPPPPKVSSTTVFTHFLQTKLVWWSEIIEAHLSRIYHSAFSWTWFWIMEHFVLILELKRICSVYFSTV